jgi:hypothetical protein
MTTPDPVTVSTSFYAPQAKLVDADGNTELATTLGDLMSAQITLVNNGVSQCQITLNNTRTDPQNPNQPIYPPWKYNDLVDFKFGQRFGVQLRYADGANAPWKPLIFCRVTDIAFAFPSSGGSTMTLTGQDLLSLLVKPDPDGASYANPDKDEIEIVNDILSSSRSNVGLSLSPESTLPPSITTKLHNAPIRKGTEFRQFIKDMADRLDYELFVDNQVTNPSAIKVHFAPARSLTVGTVIPLTWGRDIIEFTPTLRVADQYSSAKTESTDPSRRVNISAQATIADISADLHTDPRASAPMLNSVQVLQRYMTEHGDDSASVYNFTPKPGLDQARATQQCVAELRARARDLLTVQGSTIGNTNLVPGVHVNIIGLRPPFDGYYYVTQTVHTLNTSGYRTQFKLRRPGMLDPSQYLANPGSSS